MYLFLINYVSIYLSIYLSSYLVGSSFVLDLSGIVGF